MLEGGVSMTINLTKLLLCSARIINIGREIKYGETGYVGEVSSTQTTAEDSPYSFDLEEESQ